MADKTVGRLLLQCAREFSGQVCDRLRAGNYGELKTSHALVVSNLDVEGTRISVLAERAEISKQAMGVLVKELEELGYLQREADPLDARAFVVRPTERGLVWLKDVGAMIEEIEAAQIEKLGRERWETLRESLELLLNNAR